MEDVRAERDALLAAFKLAAETYPNEHPMNTPSVRAWWARVYEAVVRGCGNARPAEAQR